jgi:hypothetical protein
MGIVIWILRLINFLELAIVVDDWSMVITRRAERAQL